MECLMPNKLGEVIILLRAASFGDSTLNIPHRPLLFSLP